jgi:hypothetical protein
MSCYYKTLQQCLTTLSGVGGNCMERTYSHAQLLRRALFNHHGLARTVRVNAPERPLPAPQATTAVADEPPKLNWTLPRPAMPRLSSHSWPGGTRMPA